MNDVELESLLNDAGYRYDVTSGQFVIRDVRRLWKHIMPRTLPISWRFHWTT